MADAPARLVAALADRYRLERQLGEGGMATVYLAHDRKHDRRVAIKVLRPELAAVIGAERFLVEIRTTANLQHPHILPLFDSGEADGFLYYVMPFVDGETLRTKLDRESQLGVEEAVRIATDVADALEYAHTQGVIHRDIKPENILLQNGRPMVADFGIALAVSAAAGGRLTETGLSLGTPHYMSPEQATAERDLTPRSDQYALACVLYESLAGEPPHTGGSAQQVIMKIITEVPADLVTRRRTVPPHVAGAVATALEKLPADRFDSMHAFAAALSDSRRTVHTTRTTATTGRGAPSRSFAFAGVTTALLVAAAWGWLRPSPPTPVLRYELVAAAASGSTRITSDLPAPVGAPDGSFLVYAAPRPDGTTGSQLYRKRREQATGAPIDGSEDAVSFALSPDGRWIAFTASSQLRKVPVAGGVPDVLVESGVYGPGGVAWRDDGTLLFAKSDRGLPALTQVASDGGTETSLFVSTIGAAVIPVDVPGTELAFFAQCSSPTTCDLFVLDVARRDAQLVLKGATYSAWSPTGHLLYVASGRLMVAAFDVEARQLRGEPIEMATGVSDGLSPIHLSAAGTLSARLGRSVLLRSWELVWVDRSGRSAPLDDTWQLTLTAGSGNVGWALSPDGSRLAIGLNTEAGGDDIWIRTLPDGPLSRLSPESGPDMRPRWTADGQWVTFVRQGTQPGVFARRADGTGRDSLLLSGLVDEAALAPDGRWLLVRDGASGSVRGGRDIRGLRLGVDTALTPLIASPFDEQAVAASPDGRWIAYHANETGRSEVYVRSFPRTDEVKRQVSSGGGTSPVWSRDGRELFFLSPEREMISARVVRPGSAEMPIEFARPVTLFRVPDDLLQVEYEFYAPWDVAPDGRFLMARSLPMNEAPSRVVIAEHWLTELRERLAREGR